MDQWTKDLILVSIQTTDLDTDPDPYSDTGKMCLGGGMHCPSATTCCKHELFLILDRVKIIVE